MDEDFRKAALDYHRLPRPGKLQISPTKRMGTQRDLALAYSPGVAAACEAIVTNPAEARNLTARGNLVGVISNGTAVLGLGNIGPLAGKPVMEGKAVLFKKFAGIDVFDIEIDAADPARFIDIVASLEPTFGAINLEDIKAPECFAIEAALRARMRIPVFHDDQHGTAITVAAAIHNALRLQNKALASVRLVTAGAGAAALACVDLLCAMGLDPRNVTLTDVDGVVTTSRPDMLPNMARYARATNAATLEHVLDGADIFLGLSAPRVLNPEWLGKFAPSPIIMALANPDPEILPEIVAQRRPDAIIATGRSDFPNQVNNVLCFPFIFRGALDVGATTINQEMQIAAVEAIAGLARMEASEVVAAAYGGNAPVFGPDYIIPKPFDPRLILEIAPAVARAAMQSGVATRPISNVSQYKETLEVFVFRSGQVMRPVLEAARRIKPRIAFSEGEDPRILRAAQTLIDEGLARPVLLGDPARIAAKIAQLGLRLAAGERVEILEPGAGLRNYAELLADYQQLVGRRGIPPEPARRQLDTRHSILAAMLLRHRLVDAAIVGGISDWQENLRLVLPVIPKSPGICRVYALSGLVLPTGILFIADTHMNQDPDAEQIAEMTRLAADQVRRFGLTPKAALLSHSSFGASQSDSARKMRAALALIRAQSPELDVDGEMHADAALSESIREKLVPNSHYSGPANLLIMPNLDAANITFTTLATAAEALPIGPILLGMHAPLAVLVPTVTARGIVNLSALTAQSVTRGQGR